MHTDDHHEADLPMQWLTAARAALTRANDCSHSGSHAKVYREIADLYRRMATLAHEYDDTDAPADLAPAAERLAWASSYCEDTLFTHRAEEAVATARGWVHLARDTGHIQQSARIRARHAAHR
ncbi:hypothetical protein ACFV4N_08410 [Actinosynnema sp. NPDC059797]